MSGKDEENELTVVAEGKHVRSRVLGQPLSESEIRREAEAIAVSYNSIEGYLDRAELFSSEGMKTEAAENYKIACDILTKKISDNPKEHSLYYSRARVLDALEQYEDALLDYDKADGGDVGPDLNYYRGWCYFNAKKFAAAIDDLNKYLAVEKDDARILCMRGLAKEELNQMESAINDYLRVMQLEPENLEVVVQCATACFKLKQYRRVISIVNKCLAESNIVQYPQLQVIRADAASCTGEWAAAITDYNDVILVVNQWVFIGQDYSQVGILKRAVRGRANAFRAQDRLDAAQADEDALKAL